MEKIEYRPEGRLLGWLAVGVCAGWGVTSLCLVSFLDGWAVFLEHWREGRHGPHARSAKVLSTGMSLLLIVPLGVNFVLARTISTAAGLRTWMPLRWRSVPWERIEDIQVAKPTSTYFGSKSYRVRVRLTNGKALTLPAPLSDAGGEEFMRAADAIIGCWQAATGAVSLTKRG